jgi:hypothetical protein
MQWKKMRLTGVTRAALVGVILVGLVAAAMAVAQQGPAVLAKMQTAASPAQAAPAPEPDRVSVPDAKAAGRIKRTTPARAALTPQGSKPSLVMASATTPAAEAPANAANAALEVITITGCLQHDDGEFRLTDTLGVNAPKARSWKSGFLKKRAASLEIVDSANRLRLPTHVGQKVSVTGVLLDHEVRARSVQRLGVCS